ncbi:MAG: FAD-dependent oxidoreductase [Candidatus Babeliales bacterium]
MKKVIIIGSGIGGLVAGNLLAKKGHKVTIFESHFMPGGYTSGFWRNGFYFNSGTVSFGGSHQFFKVLKDLDLDKKIECQRLKFRFLHKNLDCILDTYENFKNKLIDTYPQEKDNLEIFFKELDKIYYAFKSLLVGKSIFKKIWGAIKALFIFKKYANITINEFIEKFFKKDSDLYYLFTNFGYPEMSAAYFGGALVCIFDDYWTIKNGFEFLANTLVDNFKQNGGELKLNSYVDKILTKDSAAVGVMSKNQKFDADVVIAACDYKNTFLNLLDNKDLISQDLLKKIEKAQISESFFTGYFGLSIPNDLLKKYLKCDWLNGEISIFSPSIINTKLAPENKSCLMVQELAPKDWKKDFIENNRESYLEFKEKIKNEFIEKASKIIPDFKNSIKFVDIATPATYQRYTHNTEGASCSWSWNPKKKFYKKLMSTNIETPVKNLYIGSCWANQVGGIPGALNAAYKCAKKI